MVGTVLVWVSEVVEELFRCGSASPSHSLALHWFQSHVGRVLGYNRLVDHVGIHGQRRLVEALNKDSLVRQKEYPMESSSNRRGATARPGYGSL
ncbi:hypothetical protein Taro_016911 [Colocasia esculenta]|uniref:Uncharacterized protein n=1 Tax=Colocasia esculenta TaxID=4460 RepID=A0A843ULM8_COLES|nr:hypothetical protein [Colocasia esculenta]